MGITLLTNCVTANMKAIGKTSKPGNTGSISAIKVCSSASSENETEKEGATLSHRPQKTLFP
ncbi:hypothetical protein PAMP_003443 [Pampus punctatissimus]